MSDGFDPALRSAVKNIARVPQLLVACDYDGTLAPIVEDPTTAAPLPEAVAAIRALAALPQTTVAVISGRALRDLAALSRLPSEVYLVGSHGSEFDVGFVEALPEDRMRLRAELHQAFLCNPHDLDGVKDALLKAVHVDRSEATRRMRAMRRHLRTHDVQAWAESFLTALERTGRTA